jgi:hypothetical protein
MYPKIALFTAVTVVIVCTILYNSRLDWARIETSLPKHIIKQQWSFDSQRDGNSLGLSDEQCDVSEQSLSDTSLADNAGTGRVSRSLR